MCTENHKQTECNTKAVLQAVEEKRVKIAKVASARKLLVYIYIILTQNVRFEELCVNSA